VPKTNKQKTLKKKRQLASSRNGVGKLGYPHTED
jgi:hypothetical protein